MQTFEYSATLESGMPDVILAYRPHFRKDANLQAFEYSATLESGIPDVILAYRPHFR